MRTRCRPRAAYPYDPTEDAADYWHEEEDLYEMDGETICRRCGRVAEDEEED